MANLTSPRPFPQMPALRASWLPLYLEPIFASGERITVAIIVDVPDKAVIKSVIRGEVLRALFGAKAAGIKGLVELCVDSLSLYVKLGTGVEGWEAPVSGFSLGPKRVAAADNVSGIVSQAIQQTASLSSLDLAAVDEIDASSVTAEEQLNVFWATQVRDIVAQQNLDLVPYFNKSARFYPEGEPVRFGFLGKGVAAHFGLMKPTNLSSTVKDLRGRLWELGKVRRDTDISKVALILYLPTGKVGDSEKQLDSVTRASNELAMEAKDSDLGFHPVTNTQAGAEMVMRLAA